jgi:hypothetical protein
MDDWILNSFFFQYGAMERSPLGLVATEYYYYKEKLKM